MTMPLTEHNKSVLPEAERMSKFMTETFRKQGLSVHRGPDFQLFPEIGGCYAIMSNPKRWVGDVRYKIYGALGRYLGTHDKENYKGSRWATKSSYRNERMLDLSLRSAVRYCYLSVEGSHGRDAVFTQMVLEEELVIFSKDGSMFAVYEYSGYDEGYSIFSRKGAMLGRLIEGRVAQYYPIKNVWIDGQFRLSHEVPTIKPKKKDVVSSVVPFFEHIAERESQIVKA